MSWQTSDLSARIFGPRSRIPVFPRIIGLTATVWAVAAVATALAVTREPRLVAVAGSFAIGWSHLAGHCGLSHLGALTPQGKLPGKRRYWLANVLVYVVTGTLASAAVGTALAVAGGLLVPARARGTALTLVLLLAVVAAASELRLIGWRLPEPKRQTRQDWRQMFRPPVPAALWGVGLGVTVATVFTFSGTWLVLTLPVALGEPAFGATLLVAHWLGRAAPVLAGPLLLDNSGRTPELLDDIAGARAVFRATNIVGIGLMALSLMLLLPDATAW